jgi:SAM-dependent methyltransferase
VIAAAYDSLAPSYDAHLASAQWVRDRLWARLDGLFAPGARVLDVTAGTGLDAQHLAGRGVRVVALDLSGQMLAQLRARCPEIETHMADFNQLERDFVGGARFDGLISTFAGLNTSADLAPFARSAARLLRPGGMLFVHLLNRWPLLDGLRQWARGQWRTAWATFASNRRLVKVSGSRVQHYAYSPSKLYRNVFASNFHLSRIEAQGLIRPVNGGWGRGLEGWERALAHRFPFHSLGTFFSLELVRRA